MREVYLYGWCTATLHLGHFVKRTVGPCALKKDVQDTTCGVHILPSLQVTLQPAASTVPYSESKYGESILHQWCVPKCLNKDLCLVLQRLQVFHCIFACVQDSAQRLQHERGATNCVSRLRCCVPRFMPKWTVRKISSDSVIYIEGCACGMGEIVCQ